MNEIERVAREHALKHFGYGEEADLAYWGTYKDREAVDKLAATITAAIAAMRGEPVGWIVGNSAGTEWRTWNAMGPCWTTDRDKATRYARREDAELVHAEDEDAWRVLPYAGPTPPASGKD